MGLREDLRRVQRQLSAAVRVRYALSDQVLPGSCLLYDGMGDLEREFLVLHPDDLERVRAFLHPLTLVPLRPPERDQEP